MKIPFQSFENGQFHNNLFINFFSQKPQWSRKLEKKGFYSLTRSKWRKSTYLLPIPIEIAQYISTVT